MRRSCRRGNWAMNGHSRCRPCACLLKNLSLRFFESTRKADRASPMRQMTNSFPSSGHFRNWLPKRRTALASKETLTPMISSPARSVFHERQPLGHDINAGKARRRPIDRLRLLPVNHHQYPTVKRCLMYFGCSSSSTSASAKSSKEILLLPSLSMSRWSLP